MLEEKVKQDFDRIVPFLDEKTTRLYVANVALRMEEAARH